MGIKFNNFNYHFIFLVYSSKFSPIGALSLPSVMLLVNLTYFYIFPIFIIFNKDLDFFGLTIENIHWTHFGVFLYAAGAIFAFYSSREILELNPDTEIQIEPSFKMRIYRLFWLITIIFIALLVFTGQIFANLDTTYLTSGASRFLFLNLSLSSLIPLTLIFMIRRNYGLVSWLVLGVVLFVLLQAGFRYRIMILLAGLVTSYAYKNKINLNIFIVLIGAAFAILASNLIGLTRTYGEGVDLTRLEDSSIADLFTSPQGELGTFYVFNDIAGRPLPDLSPLQPWIVGASRMIPSFIWENKPLPTYLNHIISGAVGAEGAGVAPPQVAEFLLQWGWWGILPLAFIYYRFSTYLLDRIKTHERSVRITFYSLAPAFFGYYMQSRGYFFQILSDGLFVFLPLFFLSKKQNKYKY